MLKENYIYENNMQDGKC